MPTLRRLLCGLVAIACFVAIPSARALDVPPAPGGRVYDAADLLDGDARARIEAKIFAFEARTSNQIAVATFPSLEGGSIEDFTIRLAEAWRPGDRERANGVILAIFRDDRRVRIEVGYGLEGALTDALSSRIIRNELAPEFRAGHYDRGVERAVDAIMAATQGEYTAKPTPEGPPRSAIVPIVVFIILFIVLSRLSASSRGTRGYTGRGVFIPPFGTSSGRRGPFGGGFWGGGFGGGGRGGGFGGGGFGGGGFGGGGASGSW